MWCEDASCFAAAASNTPSHKQCASHCCRRPTQQPHHAARGVENSAHLGCKEEQGTHPKLAEAHPPPRLSKPLHACQLHLAGCPPQGHRAMVQATAISKHGDGVIKWAVPWLHNGQPANLPSSVGAGRASRPCRRRRRRPSRCHTVRAAARVRIRWLPRWRRSRRRCWCRRRLLRQQRLKGHVRRALQPVVRLPLKARGALHKVHGVGVARQRAAVLLAVKTRGRVAGEVRRLLSEDRSLEGLAPDGCVRRPSGHLSTTKCTFNPPALLPLLGDTFTCAPRPPEVHVGAVQQHQGPRLDFHRQETGLVKGWHVGRIASE